MKKAFLLFIAFSTFSLLFAAKTPAKLSPLYAKNFMIPVGNKGQSISLLDLSTMSVKDLEALTGKKMNLVNKVSFRVAQHKLRMSINNDGTINSKKLEKTVYKVPEELDKRVAKLKLESMGIKIDRLTPEQEEYLAGWSEGT